MKNWQKVWLYFVLTFSILHLVRDIFQDFGIDNILSTIFVKSSASVPPHYWLVFVNSYVIEIMGIILAVACFKTKKFGKLGYFTICMMAYFFLAWVIYWFLF